jgi:hypothetical protein
MSPALDQFATTLLWLAIFAPVILTGLIVAIDPCGIRAGLNGVAEGIRRFQAPLGTPWQWPLFPSEPVVPPRADAALRVLCAASVAAGLPGLPEVLQ